MQVEATTSRQNCWAEAAETVENVPNARRCTDVDLKKDHVDINWIDYRYA